MKEGQMTHTTSSEANLNQPIPGQTKLTTDMMVETLNDYIRDCHDGHVYSGVGAWYRMSKRLGREHKASRKLDRAMYDWARAELQKAGSRPRIVH